MAVFYNEGEVKKRPGIYQRHTNVGVNPIAGALDGYCAIPIKASWGPLGVVVKNARIADLEKNYGTGEYSASYTVPAAKAMFEGGAATVYTYRLGTGGTAASKELDTGLTITAKYVGTMPISVAVQTKIGDNSVKQLLVYTGTKLVETFNFAADSTNEGANLAAAAAKSEYIVAAATDEESTLPATVSVLAVVSGALTGGVDPTVTNESYSTAFAALEGYHYNTIALDVDDDADMTLSKLLLEYLNNAYTLGKLGIAVVGEKTGTDFATRCTHAKSFNNEKAVYLGNGWKNSAGEAVEGALAICYTAGLIASTPTNRGITHTVVTGGVDLLTSLTFAQYEDAIDSGMLLLSMSPDGQVWYDSGINTLVDNDGKDLDAGWKKIRRVKVRFEMIDRIDRELAPKVGRVSCDTDGVADVIQAAQRVLDAMINEGKLMAGASFVEDTQNPHEGDSAWFVIQADDIDSLEKIYLQYQFRYSQNS